MRMNDGCGGSAFAGEAGAGGSAGGEMRGEHFHGDVTTELALEAFEDDPHPAVADDFEDLDVFQLAERAGLIAGFEERDGEVGDVGIVDGVRGESGVGRGFGLGTGSGGELRGADAKAGFDLTPPGGFSGEAFQVL